MKLYNFKNIIFEFSNFFWYDFFLIYEKSSKNTEYTSKTKICVRSISTFLWMNLICFDRISVVFHAIAFVD